MYFVFPLFRDCVICMVETNWWKYNLYNYLVNKLILVFFVFYTRNILLFGTNLDMGRRIRTQVHRCVPLLYHLSLHLQRECHDYVGYQYCLAGHLFWYKYTGGERIELRTLGARFNSLNQCTEIDCFFPHLSFTCNMAKLSSRFQLIILRKF